MEFDVLILLGLLINELVINTIKYSGRQNPIINLSIMKDKNQWTLIYQDNGDKDLSDLKGESSSLELIDAILIKLKGHHFLGTDKNRGFKITVNFELSH